MNDKQFREKAPMLLAASVLNFDATNAGDDEADVLVPADYWQEMVGFAKAVQTAINLAAAGKDGEHD